MSHLETAYRLGAQRAARDFETRLKTAVAAGVGTVPPGAPHPSSPVAPPKPAVASAPQIKPPGTGVGNAPPMPGTNQSTAFSQNTGSRQGAPG